MRYCKICGQSFILGVRIHFCSRKCLDIYRGEMTKETLANEHYSRFHLARREYGNYQTTLHLSRSTVDS